MKLTRVPESSDQPPDFTFRERSNLVHQCFTQFCYYCMNLHSNTFFVCCFSARCGDNEFDCADNATCILRVRVCDAFPDCPNEKDERECK